MVYLILALGLLFLFIILLSNVLMILLTRKQSFSRCQDLQKHSYGLIFGTSKYTRQGQPNLHLHARLQAALIAYRAGKVEQIIISGTALECRQIRDYLVYKNIPGQVLIFDPRGHSTYKALCNLQDLSRHFDLLIMGQKYHNYRALFLASRLGFCARAFSLPCKFSLVQNILQSLRHGHLPVRVREYFARTKTMCTCCKMIAKNMYPCLEPGKCKNI